MASMSELAEKLPEHEREHVRELAEDVLFMRRKLEDSRNGLKDQEIVIPYDNGGGQIGIRANPAFGEYQRLLKTYQSTFETLRDLLKSASTPTPAEKPKVVSVVGNSKWAKKRAANE